MKKNIYAICLIALLGQNLFAQSNEIEEIITTALKTEKTLQEVPVAVSVISADEIAKSNVIDAFDLMTVVPSLDTRQYQTSKNAAFFIRGFGNGANNAGIEPSVALFIDGVYRSKAQGRISDLPEIERIEVLRGPQSTLFGKNATAGVINIITKKPSFESYGKVSASIGNYNSKRAKVYYTGPLSDSVAYSLNIANHTRDGFAKNAVTGGEMSNRDRYSVRADLLIESSDDLEIRVTADYDEYDEFCCWAGNVAAGTTKQITYMLGAQAPPSNPYHDTVYYDHDSTSEGENSGITINIVKEMENMTLTSISSSRSSDGYDLADIDFDGAPMITPRTTNTNLDAISQEFRLASNNNEKVNWLVGAYYYQEDLEYDADVLWGPAWRPLMDIFVAQQTGGTATLAGVGALFGVPSSQILQAGTGSIVSGTQDTETTTFFAQVDINLSDKLSAILGASYIEDEKKATLSELNTDVFSQLDFVGAGTLQAIQAGFSPAAAAAIGANPDTNPLLDLLGLQFLNQLVAIPNAAEDGQSTDDNVDYTAKLTYLINDNVSVYGGIATGFKSSAWNLTGNSLPSTSEIAALAAASTPVPPNTSPGQRYARPESAEVYELGVKMRLPTGYLNITAFKQEIEDFQSNVFVSSGFILANAGLQSSEGIEFDLLFSPVSSIDITLGGLVMDSNYDSFVGSSAGDMSGTKPENVHDDSLTSAITYNWSRGAIEGYVRLNHLYSGPTWTRLDPLDNEVMCAAGFCKKTKGTLNFSAGISMGNLDIILYGNNINDDKYLKSTFSEVGDPLASSFNGYPNSPKTYGITFNYSF